MNERQLIINKALEQVGYLGKRSNKDLDDKTANASGKYTKYARDLDNLKDFYNGPKNGYDRCDVFYDRCVFAVVGEERALELLCQPKKSTGAGW